MNSKAKINYIVSSAADVYFEHDKPAANFTSFRIGGNIALIAEPASGDELRSLIKLAHDVEYPYFVIGNASNLLIQDKPLDAMFIKLGERMSNISFNDNLLYADAGALLCTTAKASVESGFLGMEWASGIPGSVGGAIAMNAGAYGGEIKQILKTVALLKGDSIIEHQVMPDELDYRYSAFSFPDSIVIGGTFELIPDDGTAKEKMNEYNKKRIAKQPLNLPSAGSAFKRPTGYFAAQLIDEAGLKGFSVGGAAVSEKHAGFIVNRDGACFNDVVEVLNHVKETIFDKFGVTLEPEIKIVTEDCLSVKR